MKNEYLEVRADWNGAAWTIKDIDDPQGNGIQVEALLMRATRTGKGFAEGYIVAVHGLDQEIAGRLDNQSLKLLGVGAQFRTQTASPKGVYARRVNLTSEGKIIGGDV